MNFIISFGLAILLLFLIYKWSIKDYDENEMDETENYIAHMKCKPEYTELIDALKNDDIELARKKLMELDPEWIEYFEERNNMTKFDRFKEWIYSNTVLRVQNLLLGISITISEFLVSLFK